MKSTILSSLTLFAAFTFSAPASAQTADQLRCTDNTVCELGDRGYHIRIPEGWDGNSTLPVLLHFHGWGRQGPVPVNHKYIGSATSNAGVLLIAPNGLGKSWDFWKAGSRDTAFTNAVLDDVAKRFPIDRENLMLSGYSWGSSMAWRYACEAGENVKILLGISGTLYNQDEQCTAGPVEVRHVHGLKDTVMDFPFGPNGEETGPVRLWQRENGCTLKAERTSNWETSQKYTRYEWDNCSTGKTIKLDVHGGGHWIAKGWLAEQLKQILSDKSS